LLYLGGEDTDSKNANGKVLKWKVLISEEVRSSVKATCWNNKAW